MALDWNPRKILAIDGIPLDPRPECPFHCVGYAPSQGRRCHNPINKSNRGIAKQLLNQMARAEKLSDIKQDLKELAPTLLCVRWHQAQADEVYNKWKRLVRKEYLRLKEREEEEREEEEREEEEREEEEREEEERERRKTLKLMNNLAKMRSIATQAKVQLEAGAEDVVATPRVRSASSKTPAFNTGANLDDPFEIRAPSSARPNIVTQASPQENIQKAGTVASDESSVSKVTREVERLAGPSSLPYMPSPPTHEPSSPIKAPRIAITEQQDSDDHKDSQSSSLNTSSAAQFAFAFGSKSESPIPGFDFGVPIDLKRTEEETLDQSNGAIDPMRFEGDNRSLKKQKSTEQPERVPLQGKAAKPLNLALKGRATTSPYEFGAEGQQPSPGFEYKAPLRPRKLWDIENSTENSLFCFNDSLSNVTISKGEKTGTLSKQPEQQGSSSSPLSNGLDVALSARPKTPTYAFGSGEKKLSPAFEFEVPSTPLEWSRSNVPADAPVLSFNFTTLKDTNSETPSTSTTAFEQPVEECLPSSDSQAHSSSTVHDYAPPTTPPKQESYGYANITPNSTRYTTTYLPARQQHGLVTPPETPEMLLRSLRKPMGDSVYFSGDKLQEPVTPQTPVPKVSRKPLPRTPSPRVDKGRVETQGVYLENSAEYNVGDLPDRSGDRGGCLARFSFSRLKEKVKGKVTRSSK